MCVPKKGKNSEKDEASEKDKSGVLPPKVNESESKMGSSSSAKKSEKGTGKSMAKSQVQSQAKNDDAVGCSMKVAKKTTSAANKLVVNWVMRTLDMGVPKLVEEFRGLSKWTPEDMTTKAFSENKDKNRYQDVPCQDKGRIVLKFAGLPSDYIHANYVGTARNPNRFICAQGPLDNTQHSFWAMIVQEKVEILVMLCNCIEMTKIKCSQYWPAQNGTNMTFGDAPNQIVVTNCGSRRHQEDQAINVTSLNVEWTDNGAKQKRLVLHYQWENWPDRGVPMSKLTACHLLSSVRANDKPILVHCSAGIGRTGTIVALAYVQEKMFAGEDCMAMNDLLKELRRQRPWSIQNEHQYLYLHRVMLAYFLEKYKDMFCPSIGAEGLAKYEKWVEDYKAATGGV